MHDEREGGTALALIWKQMARRLLAIGENRVALLTLELQEEGDRLLQGILMVFAIAVFGLLALLCMTAFMVVWLWPWSPLLALAILALTYVLLCAYLCREVRRRARAWQSLPSTVAQLKKDREALETLLA